MLLPDDLLAAESRAFFAEFADAFATPEQRESFARYGVGLMSEIDRKSIEPIAALFCKDAASRCNGMHQTLHRFVSEVPWDDAQVRSRGVDYAVAALRAQAPLEVGIIDDTGVVKAGTKSVGVDRMYCGRIGKIENCQVAVGLAVANGIDAVAIDMELYLTHTWTGDPVRRAACKIPEEIEFRTKPQLGIMMLCEAAARGIRPEVIVADSDYGKAPYFREAIRDVDMHFAVGVHADQPVRRVKHGRAVGDVRTAHALAAALDGDRFTEVRWREGGKGTLKGRFALVEVIAAEASDVPCNATERETIFLLIEWQEGAKKPEHFTLISFDARAKGLVETVRIVKERWRIERCFQEMKSELGFDHFEGRGWRGWNHHASMVLVCHAFTLAVRARVSPPPDPHAEADARPLIRSTPTSRRELVRDDSPRDRDRPREVAAGDHAA